MSVQALQERATASKRAPAARKLARVVQPTTTERFFDKNDIIVSKTDLKGHLTYVNRTFMAISDYMELELLGQPHSLIRTRSRTRRAPRRPRCSVPSASSRNRPRR